MTKLIKRLQGNGRMASQIRKKLYKEGGAGMLDPYWWKLRRLMSSIKVGWGYILRQAFHLPASCFWYCYMYVNYNDNDKRQLHSWSSLFRMKSHALFVLPSPRGLQLPLPAHVYSLLWLVLMTRQIILWCHICCTAINHVAIFQIIGSGCAATF